MSLKTYRTISTFAQDNVRYDKGVTLSLTDKQATFLLSGGFIELAPVVPVVTFVTSADEGTGDEGTSEPAKQPQSNKKGGKA